MNADDYWFWQRVEDAVFAEHQKHEDQQPECWYCQAGVTE